MSSSVCADCGGPHVTGLCATYSGVTREGAITALNGLPERGIALREGDRLGNFWLKKKLGRGASSDVYLGENEVTQALAAVKVLRAEMHDDSEMVRRFESEARTTNLVRHEHVVEIFDIGIYAGWQHYIVLEHLEGEPLTKLLERPLDHAVAVRMVLQLCAALGAAHAKGVVHRDLKPANVFVTQRDGQPHVKLVDFGMARRSQLEEGELRTRVGTILGTAMYMSPEQVLGQEIDGRADIYSLGVLMYQLATGRVPFDDGNVVDVMMAHTTKPVPPPRSVNPRVTPNYENVIMRCLAKDRADRWASIADVGRAVAQAISGRPVASVPAPRPGPQITAHYKSDETLPRDFPIPSMSSVPTLPAVRRAARIPTSFGVQLYAENGAVLGDAIVTDVSLGGAFVRSSLALPLFTRVRIVGQSSKGPVDVFGEVVRYEQNETRHGFGVQFADLNEAQTAVLSSLMRDRDRSDGFEGDADAEAELKQFEARVGTGYYGLIGLPQDASTRRIRDVCERLALEMAPKRFPKLSAKQRSRLDILRFELTEAEEVLIDPQQRALYDAVNGNVLGVLRCITEGLELEKLGRLRSEFLKKVPDAEDRARPALQKMEKAEQGGDVTAALRALADALCHDPLNLKLHRHAVELRQKRP